MLHTHITSVIYRGQEYPATPCHDIWRILEILLTDAYTHISHLLFIEGQKYLATPCHDIRHILRILLTIVAHMLRLLFIGDQEYLATPCHDIWYLLKMLLTNGCTHVTSVIY
jgi:hypothetical protein